MLVWYKVGNPYSVNILIKLPIFEQYVLWCNSKNGNQKDMCNLKGIGLHAQNMITITCFINIIEETYETM